MVYKAIRIFFAFQRMYKLPKNINTRLWFYINFMSIAEEVIKYLLFLSGAMLLVWSIWRILCYQMKKLSSEWVEMERKRRKTETNRQSDPKAKDVDVYNTLLTSVDPNMTLMV